MNAKLVKQNGVLRIDINGRVLDPVAYRSFRPQPQTVANFARRGFGLYGVFPSGILCSLGVPYSQFGEVWMGDGAYDWDNLNRQADLFAANAPDGYFQLMVHLDTRGWFLRDHPACADSFTGLANAAGYAAWRESAARFTCDMIDYLDKRYPERVFAVYLFAGGTCEWFTGSGAAEGYHAEKERAYRQWACDDGVRLPPPEALRHTRDGMFRHPREDAEAIRYWRFLNELTADTISWFARAVKNHTDGTRLVGAFYGYLNIFDPAETVQVGHNALSRVLDDPNVDILFSPASYALRGMENVSGFQLPVDSLRLRGKLYFHEIDNTTHLANGNPCAQKLQQYAHKRMKDMRETVMYSRREAALALMKGAGYWWFDMFSGWYDDDALMDELGGIRRATEALFSADMSSVSEVAFLIDEASNLYVGPDSGLGYTLVRDQGEQLGRMGLPWDCYVASDITRGDFPRGRYGLYVFANLYCPSAQIREAISALRSQGKSMLFLHAPGYIGPGGFDAEGMKELTGMSFAAAGAAGKVVVAPGPCNPGPDDLVFGFASPVSPMFSPVGSDIEIMGRYESGEPAFAVRKRGSGFDAFCGAGPVPGRVLRMLAARAGAFVYSDSDDPVYVNRSLAGMFSRDGGARRLRFPCDCVLTEVFTGECVRVVNGEAALVFAPDEMKLFSIVRC